MAYNGSPMAPEFTPELSSQYLSSILNPIDQQEQADVGAAKTAGAAGGKMGKFSAGAQVGAIQAGAQQNRSAAIGKFNLDVANAQYGERMTDQGQSFEASQNQQNRDLQTSLAAMGYQEQNALEGEQNLAAHQGAIFGGVASLGAGAIGGYFAGL